MMRVLLYEDNLIWSSRLLKSLRSLGHDPVLLEKPEVQEGPVAIVNLGSSQLEPCLLVPKLVEGGVVVIGHAGHKEKDLLELGKSSGCQVLATNSQITFKLDEVLSGAMERVSENF